MSRAPRTVAAAGRRFVLLTAMRWLPAGLVAPVVVLLASARGLTPSDIGLVFVAHSVVALLLELPTGGLADLLGRRPVMLLAAALQTLGLLVLASAGDLATFAAAFALVGAARALDSGPLEAWYVDAVHVLDPDADITGGLSRAAAATGAGLAFGTIAGGAVPAVLARLGGEGMLAAPFLVAAAMQLAYLGAVATLVVPVSTAVPGDAGRAAPGSRWSALGGAVRGVPAVVRDTVALTGRDPVLRRIVALSFLTGIVLAGLELLGPLHFARLAGGTTEGTAVFGVVLVAAFTAAAVGSSLAPGARRLARGSTAVASAALFVLSATAVAGVAAATVVWVAAVAFAAFYLCNGLGWPLRQQLMHRRVESRQRATTVSASSFALMLGGICGGLVIPRLAEAATLAVGFWASVVPMLLSVLLSLRLEHAPAPAAEPPAAEPAEVDPAAGVRDPSAEVAAD